ncbi:MAG: hypothetical protein MZV70_45855 [Desulfobacterales bacterium]|nr:hypothetical protein [Desulfobacterales bacterium]
MPVKTASTLSRASSRRLKEFPTLNRRMITIEYVLGRRSQRHAMRTRSGSRRLLLRRVRAEINLIATESPP